MARAAPKLKNKSRSGSPVKKPVGRPPGSKNKVPRKTGGKVATARVSKPEAAPIRKNASASPKLSKADLEAQVIKLERALALSRKRVAELKRMMSDADARADQVVLEKPAATLSKQKPVKQKSVKQKSVKQKVVATSGRRKKAEAAEQDEPVLDEATGEAETEAHAS